MGLLAPEERTTRGGFAAPEWLPQPAAAASQYFEDPAAYRMATLTEALESIGIKTHPSRVVEDYNAGRTIQVPTPYASVCAARSATTVSP
jgi:hypothetical protein